MLCCWDGVRSASAWGQDAQRGSASRFGGVFVGRRGVANLVTRPGGRRGVANLVTRPGGRAQVSSKFGLVCVLACLSTILAFEVLVRSHIELGRR